MAWLRYRKRFYRSFRWGEETINPDPDSESVTNGVLTGSSLRTVASGIDHPEGVCWSPTTQKVYAGGEGGQLYCFCLSGDGKSDPVTTVTDGELLGLALDGAGNLYACDPAHHRVQRISPDGAYEAYGSPIAYPNYPVFDSEGGLWVSDSGDWEEPSGAIFRILPGGATEKVPTRALRFANGLAIAGEYLYVVESGSRNPAVSRLPLAGGELETLVELVRTVPDGLAFDAEGGLWISCCQPNRIYRLDANGPLETVVDDWSGEWVVSPTNTAFAGPDLDVLVLASLFGHAVKAIDPGVRGMPLRYPHLGTSSAAADASSSESPDR